jgi:hypothetical protein
MSVLSEAAIDPLGQARQIPEGKGVGRVRPGPGVLLRWRPEPDRGGQSRGWSGQGQQGSPPASKATGQHVTAG